MSETGCLIYQDAPESKLRRWIPDLFGDVADKLKKRGTRTEVVSALLAWLDAESYETINCVKRKLLPD